MADNNSDSEDPTTAELLNQLDDISTGALDEGEILDDATLATDSTTAVDEQAITADTITEATPTITAWDIFRPCLEKMNSRRAKLLATMLLVLDESKNSQTEKVSTR
jgi:hypothetical protein